MDARSVFISDCHLGSPYAQSVTLAKCLSRLRQTPPDYLWFVGDLFDFWQFNRRWVWNDACDCCMSEIAWMVRHEVQVRWLLGNHDAMPLSLLPRIDGLLPHEIHVGCEFLHRTAADREMIVTHGHEFDVVSKADSWFHVGDFWYQWLKRATWVISQLLRHLGSSRRIEPRHFSDPVKRRVHNSSRFEQRAIEHGRALNAGGIICGHSHVPRILTEPDKFIYANCGDFVESCTMIVESRGGSLRLEKVS